MSCPVNNFAEPFEFGEDGVGGRGPFERFGMLVVGVDEQVDLALQVVHRAEGAAADRLVGDQSEPALELVEPGTVGRREVDMEPRPPGQPRTNTGMLVGGVVVTNQVDVEIGGALASMWRRKDRNS